MKKSQIPVWEERVMYSGPIIEVINQDFQTWDKLKTFEIARRSPWVRLIIEWDDKKILLTKEYRHECDSWDYRLPGWKVYDTKQERADAETSNILIDAENAAKKECKEETWLIANSIEHFCTSHAWATVEWDLHYFIINDFSISELWQELESWESITVGWYTLDEVKQLVKDSMIKEDRSLGVLFKYSLNK